MRRRGRCRDASRGFFAAWKDLAVDDRRLARLVGREGARWIRDLPASALEALDAATVRSGTGEQDRIDYLGDHVLSLPGWVGYARWCDEWAPPTYDGVRLSVLDVVAVLASLHAAAGSRPSRPVTPGPDVERERRQSVIERFAEGDVDADQQLALATVLDRLPTEQRADRWLRAHETNFRNRLLGLLQRPDPGAAATPSQAQVVMCIDVRSEGLRRHLEAVGPYETFGFAGFFGIPLRWRTLGSHEAQARCPVLVSPRHEVTERPLENPDRFLAREAGRGAAHEALHDTKKGLGSPFALAEAAGWLTGPLAAARTFAPGRSVKALGSDRPDTEVVIDAADHDVAGFTLDERALFAEAIVKTIGFTRFAPIVMFCGHASHTTNNPHASSLDCGACGGAPGGPSARVAAAVLNDHEVRARLRPLGIDIPDETVFIAGEHETASDTVTLLDRHLVPDSHIGRLDQLDRDLATAGAGQAGVRSRRLPGNPQRVRSRGRDWAQVRPEWGLAGNAAFVVGPRSITRELDLAGRVFLHSYEPSVDPDAVALETILTAPLVVAQWISSQYYFSSIDPVRFGAGDKMLHNPIGSTLGVVLGQGGDLATGLPLQSVSVGAQRAHDPLRLLAVVQAPLEQVEAIILRNSGLRQLVENQWITMAGRSHSHEDWSIRSPEGTWETWHAATTTHEPTAISLELR